MDRLCTPPALAPQGGAAVLQWRMRAVHLFLLLGLACGTAMAQTTSPTPHPGSAEQRQALQNPEQAEGRTNQRTERIHIEDGGSRIDELRVGGQTQNISVQNKTSDLPAYEVQSPDGARSRSGSFNGAETNTGPRVWNVLKF
jgi:hypothetical protein